MNHSERIPFFDENGEKMEFYILEQTTLNGFHYLLVEDGEADPDEEETVVYILRGNATSSTEEEEMAAYEMVEDEEELMLVSKIFEQLMEDTEFM